MIQKLMRLLLGTRLSHTERLQHYKEALNFIKNHIEFRGSYGEGFCHALSTAASLLNSRASRINIYKKLIKIFPELKPYEPKNHGMYWFASDNYHVDDQKRIQILEEIIKSMESDSKPAGK